MSEPFPDNTIEDCYEVSNRLKETFKTGKTKSLEWRLEQLQRLEDMVKDNKDLFIDALVADLHRGRMDARLLDLFPFFEEIKYLKKHTKSLMKPRKVGTSMAFKPSSAYVQPRPYGTTLVIAPFNFPVMLSLGPLAGAISAGNCSILRPSPYTIETTALICRLVPEYLDTDAIVVLAGEELDVPLTTTLLAPDEACKIDFVFFTGSSTVGKIIARQCVERFIPYVLELGGENPSIVTETANLDVSAKRLCGKFFNASQICVAPNYLMVHEDVYEEFTFKYAYAVREVYGENPQETEEFGRIIADRHFSRLKALLDDALEKGATPLLGGTYDEKERYMAPTLLEGVTPDMRIANEEIFGPILPIYKYSDIEECVAYAQSKPPALAAYVFSKDKHVIEQYLSQIQAGGVCINDIISHVAVEELPFGGVGKSGFGSYHGKQTFDCFSHLQSTLHRGWISLDSGKYPNRSNFDKWMVDFMTE
ncbi:hypothetical protein PCE1_002190 [Barthelona sp. PCE]